jgi:rod shape-determining protein MreD
MRWIGFILLIALAAVIQTTVVSWIRIHRIGPDLLFLVAVYYLLQAPPAEALLAAWAAGLTLDLFSDVRVGTFALSFGLVGLAVIRIREMLFKDHPLTQLVVALVGCGLSQILARAITALLEPSLQWGLADVLLGALYTALYTAILAPYGLWLLDRFRGPLGLKPADRLRRRRRR